MRFESEQTFLDARLNEIWKDSEFGEVPIAWDGVDSEDSDKRDHIAPTVLTGAGFQASIDGAGGLHRYPGIYQVDVMVRSGDGVDLPKRMASVISDGFTSYVGKTSGGDQVVCRTVSATRQPTTDGWLHFAVTVVFERDALLV